MTNWYLDRPSGWSNDYHDEIAAHEAGHMFGNFDEYSGGATYNGYTTTGTLMSDLTRSGFERYFWTQEYYTEFYGSVSLTALRAIQGSSSSDNLTGTSAVDGFYALGGNDKLSGNAGNDFLDGGGGRDNMNGGLGRDVFDFDLVTDSKNSSTSRDVIGDFLHLGDLIDVSGMDASSVLSGNNAFTWRGSSAFTAGSSGELRFVQTNNAGTANDFTVIFGDVDSDTASEFQIELRGLVGLTSPDFVL
jgi:Ca2+-binding RTX toxin-like protein